ncbi:MAG: DUF1559 domain-containing protein [Lentisphaeraceae bacterium]|nr:DUF1559 domain-containing protein [Lentisphaeraceae bacterium]
MPSLKNARHAAKATVCGSNQKQLGIAMMSYTVSNNGYLTAPPATHYTWDDLLSPYDGRDIPTNWKFTSKNSTGDWSGTFLYEDWDKKSSLYNCPIDAPNDGKRTNRSYAVNSGFPSGWSTTRGPIMSGYRILQKGVDPWSMKLEAINNPSKTILMGEVTVYDKENTFNLGSNNGSVRTNFRAELKRNPVKHGRNLMLNYLFNDLHVSFLSYHTLNGDSDKYLWGDSSNVIGTFLDCRK